MTDFRVAWSEIHDVKPDGWFGGRPVFVERRVWEQYAFDTRELAKHGRRSGEWTGRPPALDAVRAPLPFRARRCVQEGSGR
jgi:hypothetical protein